MKKTHIYAISIILFTSLNVVTQAKAENIMNMSQAEIEINTSLFINGKTTASEVKTKLGKPMIENIKGDGQSLFMYNTICTQGHTECMTNFIFNNEVLTSIGASNR